MRRIGWGWKRKPGCMGCAVKVEGGWIGSFLNGVWFVANGLSGQELIYLSTCTMYDSLSRTIQDNSKLVSLAHDEFVVFARPVHSTVVECFVGGACRRLAPVQRVAAVASLSDNATHMKRPIIRQKTLGRIGSSWVLSPDPVPF